MKVSILLLFIITIGSLGSFCNKKKSGFYCNTDHSYYWCYGHPQPSEMMCPAGTSCKCGYSSFNPCGFHQQDIQDCNGSFQDNLPSEKPSPPPSNDNDNNQNNNDQNNNDNNNNQSTDIDKPQDDDNQQEESFEETNFCEE